MYYYDTIIIICLFSDCLMIFSFIIQLKKIHGNVFVSILRVLGDEGCDVNQLMRTRAPVYIPCRFTQRLAVDQKSRSQIDDAYFAFCVSFGVKYVLKLFTFIVDSYSSRNCSAFLGLQDFTVMRGGVYFDFTRDRQFTMGGPVQLYTSLA